MPLQPLQTKPAAIAPANGGEYDVDVKCSADRDLPATSPEPAWPCPPRDWTPQYLDLDVWAVELDEPPERRAAWTATLSAEEKTRAAAFRFERDQNRFMAGRGALRVLLGCYTGLPPEKLVFRYGAHGKPELAGTDAAPPLHFNLAHSDHLALLAFARSGAVGVDVEKIRPVGDESALARRFFMPCESAALAALPEARRAESFFRLWTRKEAWLKAAGTGLSGSLSAFEVTFLPGDSARLVSIHGQPAEAANWSLLDLSPAAGFMAAVAVRQTQPQIRCWRYEHK